ncbi:uncharacterized protein PADG_11703 [Paracoccidioides brasiliensis Pb18]|uniref:Uncharacterized protein n=1 Tax=Paracoccidioides brasiliensis (strain Pb18) TaxID=502780 RepID=A0A0A0HXR3_PARBD|nr:uncharacterized protein PADG_11703 [Paracoccidioides brasiliensis Pb18]KGM92165.1 hypothetical protein PADG_11703 [Paracoccidioides brasiliensis Pb18]
MPSVFRIDARSSLNGREVVGIEIGHPIRLLRFSDLTITSRMYRILHPNAMSTTVVTKLLRDRASTLNKFCFLSTNFNAAPSPFVPAIMTEESSKQQSVNIKLKPSDTNYPEH